MKKNQYKNPVNKSLDSFINKKLFRRYQRLIKDNNFVYPSVSIITCTMRPNYIDNVFNNYIRQNYEKKELIIILNNNDMDINLWKERASQYKNVKVFQLDEKTSLGECLNFGVRQSNNEIIAKFDDDDYYGPKYLRESVKAFSYTNAGLIGKAASFVYFEKYKILAIRSPMLENRYVKHIDGPTMLIRREVFDKVKFADIPRGVDTRFSKDCLKKGIKLYSIDRFHHVYVRHSSSSEHTWKVSNEKLLSRCKIVRRNITNFSKYVDV
ncbi:glycosyltransferase [Caloranaerobacter ferrireducens]|uniref:glycosyltransferase n=1 Tax=Caloranaerobacter ferrireducens TaxID=1323370 RepID=UPI0009F6EE43|nr:glycosyltransferase [Caloranaerobacter ferrireducens]